MCAPCLVVSDLLDARHAGCFRFAGFVHDCFQPMHISATGDMTTSTSVFVSHPDAAAVRRKELADFFMKLDPKHHIQKADMEARLNQKGNQALRATTKNLAVGLPVFRVMVI